MKLVVQRVVRTSLLAVSLPRLLLLMMKMLCLLQIQPQGCSQLRRWVAGCRAQAQP